MSSDSGGRGDPAAAVRAFLAEHPGSSRAEVAAAVGVPATSVGKLLGEDARRLLVTSSAQESDFTEASILAALRDVAAALGEPLSADSYDEVWRDYSGPSSVRIIQRFGSWNTACRAAGLRVNAGRTVYRRSWTQDQLVDAVAEISSRPAREGPTPATRPGPRSTTGGRVRRPSATCSATGPRRSQRRWLPSRRAADPRGDPWPSQPTAMSTLSG